MKKSCLCLFFLASWFSFDTHAQFLVTGLVRDAVTREPLQDATVFCQNTTLGTFTGNKGEFSLSLNEGGYDLIISYIGYQTQSFRVDKTSNLEILMLKEEKKLDEVILSNKKEAADGWNLYGEFFIKNFIGATPNALDCHLQNREVLKFYYNTQSNKLKVLASAPLKINNKSLGYTLNYQLDSFVYYYDDNLSSYRGYCMYTEMEGNAKEKKVWATKRKKAYDGSVLHFMRSYYNKTLSKDGWDMGMLVKNNTMPFVPVADPYDTAYYKPIKNTRQKEVWFPRTVSITYLKGVPEPEYLEKYDLPVKTHTQTSLVEMKERITIKENGYYYPPMAWITYSYWSWKNIADQLPYDYLPGH